MSYRKFQTYFFITILGLAGLLTLLVFWPYLTLLALGGVIAIITRPIFNRILISIKSETAAAFLTIVIAATVILLPTALFLASLSAELGAVFSKTLVATQGGSDSLVRVLQANLPPSLHGQVPAIVAQIGEMVSSIAGALSQNLVGVFSNVFNVFFGFVVAMISAYYLLKDGSKIKRELLVISPLSDEHDEIVLHKVVAAVGAVMNGLLVVGLVKGVLSAMFLWIFGVPAPLFWGAMSGFASLIPFFGSGIVMIPAIVYLFIIGHTAAGIGLLVISIGLIGMIDNFLQPKLVESKIKIHPLLILLSILGGLEFYGFSGFILGPLTLAALMALVDIYKKEFRTYMDKADESA